MEKQPTHIAKPELITAVPIVSSVATETGYQLTLADGREVEMPLPTSEILRIAQAGDYLITGDRFKYIVAKTVFEHRYMPLADLPLDPRPLYRPLPPAEVCQAAELVGRYFASQNIGNWELGQCRIRFPRGERA